MAIYYAIVQNNSIQMDIETGQLEIYEDEYFAKLNCPICCDVVEINVIKSSN